MIIFVQSQEMDISEEVVSETADIVHDIDPDLNMWIALFQEVNIQYFVIDQKGKFKLKSRNMFEIADLVLIPNAMSYSIKYPHVISHD